MEKIRKRQKENYHKDVEETKRKRREYRTRKIAEDPDFFRKYKRKQYWKNPEKYREMSVKHYKKNREYYLGYHREHGYRAQIAYNNRNHDVILKKKRDEYNKIPESIRKANARNNYHERKEKGYNYYRRKQAGLVKPIKDKKDKEDF